MTNVSRLRAPQCCLVRRMSFVFSWTLLTVLLLGATPYARASFSLTFQGHVRDLNAAGALSLSSPSGLVLDLAGNTYLADTGNNRIVRFDVYGNASVVTISGLSPSLASPTALAVDAAGDLYVADTGNNRVVEVSATGAGSVVSTGSIILSTPRGVAVDQAGNLFLADTGNNRIVEVTSGGTATALTFTVASGSVTLRGPRGLAVDTAGKLYIADAGNNRIVKLTVGSPTAAVAGILGGMTLNNPGAVALDRIGNVFIADTGNNRIAEIDTSSNGTVLFTGSSSLNGPLALAVDPLGTVLIADTGGSRALVVNPLVNGDLSPGNPTYSLNQSTVGFGHVQLGSSIPTTLDLQFTTGSSALGAVKVLTFGTENLDFTPTSATTCTSSTTASASCTVEVRFLPTASGLRNGAVVLYDPSLNPILTLPLYGFGDAPVAALSTNPGTVLATGSLSTVNPFQIVADGAGNVYVGNYSGQNVIRIATGGGGASLVRMGTPGSIAPQNITGVALDGAGNLFVGDHLNSRVLVVTPGGVVSALTISGLSQGLGFPTALNFDSAGNLYIADFTNGRIVKVSSLVVAGSTSSGLGTVIGTGSYSFTGSTLTGLSVDAQGTLYIAARTQNSSRIVKVTNTGVASTVAVPGNITPAISNPQGVAVDPMGNLYIVDTANNRIVELTTAGVASAIRITGLTSPSTLGSLLFGVTADANGNLYIPDWTNNRIVSVNVSASSFSYASTNVGSTSSDSPKTSTVTNLGNLPLALSANPAYTPDFSANGNDANPCAASTSLNQGLACDVSINFTPQSAGALSANITVTDNSLNVPGAVQTIAVSGTGIRTGDSTTTTVTVTPASIVNGQTVSITATVADSATGNSATVPTGTVSFTDTVGATTLSLPQATLSGGTATLTGIQLSGIGQHTITANYAGVSSTFLASIGTVTAALSKAPGSLAGPATQPVSLTPGQAGAISVSVTGPYATLAVPSGVLAYNILDGSGASVASGSPALTAATADATATIPVPSTLASGIYTVQVQYAGDANYLAVTTPLNIELDIAQLTSSITWHPSAAAIPYGTSLNGILDATAASGNSPVPGTFTYTASLAGGAAVPVTSATVLGAGSYTLTAAFNPTDAVTYTAATSTTSLVVDRAATANSVGFAPAHVFTTSTVVLTATVTSSAGTPSSSVSFYDGSTLLGPGVLSNGVWSLSSSSFAAGAHAISAVYAGDSNFATSTGTASFTVDKVVPTVALAASANPILVGNSVTFTATILASSGAPVSQVTFFDGATSLGSALPVNGVATYTTATLAAGSHSITAIYTGDAILETSTSEVLTETVQDFEVTIPVSSNPAGTTQTVVPGGTATYTLALGPVSATTFPSPVTLTVSGLPAGATATLTPDVLPAGSSLTNVTLTIKVPQTTASLVRPGAAQTPPCSKGFGVIALGALLLPFATRFRRPAKGRTRPGGLLLLLILGSGAVAGLAGCGAKDSGFFGQQPHSYDVTVTATSGSVSHTATVTLIVQ